MVSRSTRADRKAEGWASGTTNPFYRVSERFQIFDDASTLVARQMIAEGVAAVTLAPVGRVVNGLLFGIRRVRLWIRYLFPRKPERLFVEVRVVEVHAL